MSLTRIEPSQTPKEGDQFFYLQSTSTVYHLRVVYAGNDFIRYGRHAIVYNLVASVWLSDVYNEGQQHYPSWDNLIWQEECKRGMVLAFLPPTQCHWCNGKRLIKSAPNVPAGLAKTSNYRIGFIDSVSQHWQLCEHCANTPDRPERRRKIIKAKRL